MTMQPYDATLSQVADIGALVVWELDVTCRLALIGH